jgi:hypothetical protein
VLVSRWRHAKSSHHQCALFPMGSWHANMQLDVSHSNDWRKKNIVLGFWPTFVSPRSCCLSRPVPLPTAARPVRLGCCSAKGKKVHITSLNFRKSPFFITELQNQAKHLPQLLKPFILPLWPCYKQFWRRFCLFLFYLFRLNLWKIIVNHRKIIKQKIQFCWTPHE